MKIVIKREQNPNLFEILSSVNNLREAKKKHCQLISMFHSIWKSKFVSMMRITLFFILIAVTQVIAGKTYSQNSRLSLHLKNVPAKNILQQIEDNTGYYFIYDASVVDVERKVSIEAIDETITGILDALFDGSNVEYKINNRQIALTAGSFAPAVSQQTKISGKVTDQAGMSLPGVSVTIKGTTNGTITGTDGRYQLASVPSDGVLVFSFVGMKTQEVPVGKQAQVNIVLLEETYGIEEIVAIGYGTQKKSSITGAIASMPAEDVENIPVPNLSNALAGRISGVYVNQASGLPGYAASIRVRSVNTWKDTGNDPLYVIDGVISDKSSFDALDYSEVESITVLKDAASGAIYGARAANGVILVTTKTGEAGKFKLDYNYSYSFDRPSQLPDYMNMANAVKFNNMAYAASGQPPFADEEEVAYYNENDPAKDYYDKAYNDAVLQKHSLTGTGGTDKVRYFVGASYFDQTGFIETTGFKKFNIRSNLDIKFTEDLSGTFKFSYNEGETSRFSYQEDNVSTFDTNPEGGFLIGRLLYYLAFTRPMTTDGHFINPGWIGNPLAFIKEGGTNKTTNNNTDFQIGLKYKVPKIDGLSVSGNFSRNLSVSSNKHYEVKPTVYDVVRLGTHGLIYTDEIIGSRKTSYPSKEYLGQRQITNKSYQLNFSVNYEKTFDKHNINAVAVYEQSEGIDNTFYGVRENFPLLQRDQFWATGSSRDDSYVDGSDYEYGRASYIGRLSYQYDEKYFLNATIRRDGSMLFAPGYRWGNFPSVALGWVLSNENFMKEGFFDYLKLRATWGLAGNDAVGGWEWAESFKTNGSYMMGTSMVPRVVYNGIVNGKLTWEKTSEFNIGLDSRILDGLIFNLEYYHRHNYDILDSRIVSLPASFGGSMPPVNYGIVNAEGVEFELGYSGKAGEVNYGVKANLTYAVNKVKEKDVAENVRDVNNPIGRSTDYVACLVSKGIMRTQADIDALPDGYTIYGKQPALGAINFEDVSGLEPGKPDGKIDDYDRQVMKGKHYLPPYTYGLNLTADWKGFGVDIFFQGALGVYKMYNDGYGRRFHQGVRPPQFWVDSWTPDNIDAKYPQAVTWDYTMDHLESTFWLKKGNYLRLQYANLNYSLPKHVVQAIRLDNVKFLLTGTNLFTISPFDYYDPTLSEIRGYPTMRTITLGVNVTI